MRQPEGRMVEQVVRMHEGFGINYKGPPRHLTIDEKRFRVECLREELDEYADAGTMVDQYDALLDMLVFLLGTFHRHGFPVQEGLDVVMACNLAKSVGPNAKRGGFSIDLVKPPNWTGPENVLRQILAAHMQGGDCV